MTLGSRSRSSAGAKAPDGQNVARRLDEIDAAFRRVKSSADGVMRGDEMARDRSFEEIFSLNNEIGRMAREEPASMRKMRELQLCVNAITVAMKYDKKDDLREGLSTTEGALRALRGDAQSPP